MAKAEDMFGQLIHRLATSSISPAVEEESPAAQESPVRQWRVVSQDGVSNLFDLDLPQCDPGEFDPLESAEAENDTTRTDVVASFSIDAPMIGSRRCTATSPNIGMPSALPRTSEILQAAAASRSIETREPRRPADRQRTPLLSRRETQPDCMDATAKAAVQPDSSSPVVGDSDAISRSLVADAAAAAPVRFRSASPLAVLKTAAARREIDANLAKIITQWPDLTWPVQAAVLAMVDATAHES